MFYDINSGCCLLLGLRIAESDGLLIRFGCYSNNSRFALLFHFPYFPNLFFLAIQNILMNSFTGCFIDSEKLAMTPVELIDADKLECCRNCGAQPGEIDIYGEQLPY